MRWCVLVLLFLERYRRQAFMVDVRVEVDREIERDVKKCDGYEFIFGQKRN
ncbi:unnamed protein product [Trifolium pratense]|uniref:Uncharacterized protein n=1 Tax=Trifolium pratense TaxID=57577 RepID=A0ACB0J0B5_TRIPR|nr:unnamed protein product [Trifolium pratense]